MNKLSRYKFFFFDFDGVIVDSLDVKTAAFGELFKDYGQDIAKKVINYHLDNGGVSRYEKFRYYYKHFLKKRITAQIMHNLDRKYSKIVTKKVVAARFIKGAMTFIRQLKRSKKECFIVSATPQKEVKAITRLKRIDGFFNEIVGSPKKKTQNLSFLLRKYGIKNGEAIYFGDAKSDYEAAKANNIAFIGIVNKKSRELKRLSDVKKIQDFSRRPRVA